MGLHPLCHSLQYINEYAPLQFYTSRYRDTNYPLPEVLHVGQAIYFRLWYLLPTIVLAGAGEILGWSGRLWSSINIPNEIPFLMQYVSPPPQSYNLPLTNCHFRISTTIIAPTFLTAANFIIFGRIVDLLGPQYNRVSPGACTYPLPVFLSFFRFLNYPTA